MHLAEALVEKDYESYGTSEKREAVYDAVFFKHNITQAEYDSSLVWYGKHMDIYMSIHKFALRDVNASIAALGDIKPSPLSGEMSAKDSIDVWIYDRNFTFMPERIFNTFSFDIAPEAPYSSGSSYVLEISTWGLHDNMKHKPKIHISAVHADTIISVNKEITKDGDHQVVLRTIATKQVKRVYGYMMVNNAEAQYHRIYLDDIKLMKYNYGSKALTAPQTDFLSVDSTQITDSVKIIEN